jgi:predicted amidohydrolase YtcJ
VAGAKFYADGIPTNNRTAWLYQPYVDGGNGSLVIEGATDAERVRELHRMIRAVHEAGLQIGTHATGDRAIDAVVDGYLAAMAAAPRRDPRHYLIHADLVSPGTLARMARHGIGANFNASIKHLIADGQRASIGPVRAGYEWPYRTALDAGVRVATGSDAPVTDGDWRQGLSTCLLRKGKQSGTVSGPEQRITLTEALRTYTTTGAWQDFAEGWKGSLQPGWAADLIVLDGPLATMQPADYPGIKVTLTLVGGRIGYRG